MEFWAGSWPDILSSIATAVFADLDNRLAYSPQTRDTMIDGLACGLRKLSQPIVNRRIQDGDSWEETVRDILAGVENAFFYNDEIAESSDLTTMTFQPWGADETDVGYNAQFIGDYFVGVLYFTCQCYEFDEQDIWWAAVYAVGMIYEWLSRDTAAAPEERGWPYYYDRMWQLFAVHYQILEQSLKREEEQAAISAAGGGLAFVRAESGRLFNLVQCREIYWRVLRDDDARARLVILWHTTSDRSVPHRIQDSDFLFMGKTATVRALYERIITLIGQTHRPTVIDIAELVQEIEGAPHATHP
jgi:hypothetical protein